MHAMLSDITFSNSLKKIALFSLVQRSQLVCDMWCVPVIREIHSNYVY